MNPSKASKTPVGEAGRRLRSWLGIASLWSLALSAAEVPSADSHWAFQPVVRPAIPAAKISAGAANPVDAFIRARLSESGLTPSSEADRGTLIRRLYLVMLGVPPTPEEVSAFLADLQPRAWER